MMGGSQGIVPNAKSGVTSRRSCLARLCNVIRVLFVRTRAFTYMASAHTQLARSLTHTHTHTHRTQAFTEYGLVDFHRDLSNFAHRIFRPALAEIRRSRENDENQNDKSGLKTEKGIPANHASKNERRGQSGDGC